MIGTEDLNRVLRRLNRPMAHASIRTRRGAGLTRNVPSQLLRMTAHASLKTRVTVYLAGHEAR